METLPFLREGNKSQSCNIQVSIYILKYVFNKIIAAKFITQFIHREKMAQAYDFALDKIGMDIHSYSIWNDYVTFLKSVEAVGSYAENQKISAVRKVMNYVFLMDYMLIYFIHSLYTLVLLIVGVSTRCS